MLFNSHLFLLVFLPIVWLGIFVLQRYRNRSLLLAFIFLASLIFYRYSSAFHLAIFTASIIFNFYISGLCRASSLCVAIGIAGNLGLLGVFKYAGFVTGELHHAGVSVTVFSYALPLAISFYTFQQISFLVDIRRGVTVRPGFLTYAAYVSFFPQLVAGPIVRFNEVAARLRRRVPFRITANGFRLGIVMIALGLAKKILLADRFAGSADAAFDDVAQLTLLDAWAGLLAFGLQIYFDFSAYSDIAIGLARVLGIRLPDNFNSPYKATSAADFWRRWHVTLSRFLRDYLYIPLGGNRHGPKRTLINLTIVMALGGLWHGANWTFILWGLLHGSYLMIHRLWNRYVPLRCPPLLAWGLTFFAVRLAWIPFRATSTEESFAYFLTLFDLGRLHLPARFERIMGDWPLFRDLSYSYMPIANFTVVVGLLIGLGIALVLPNTKEVVIRSRGRTSFAVLTGGLTGLVLIFLLEEPANFVYFIF